MSIRLRTPDDILATIPYQLGFVPERSLVAIFTRERGVILVARLDIPAEISRTSLADRGFGQALDRAAGAGADAVVLVAYDARPAGWLAMDSALALTTRAGLEVLFAALVDGDRWAHVGCDEPECASSWRAVVAAADCGPVAELVGMGRGVLPDRASAIARLEPDRAFQARLPALSRRQRRTPVLATSWWQAFFDLAQPLDGPDAYNPSPEAVISLARSLLDRDFRDALLAHLAPGILPLGELPFGAVLRARAVGAGAVGDHSPVAHPQAQHLVLARCLLLATRAPEPLSAGPYVVASVLAGRLGDGMTAQAAVEAALLADPGHVLAGLIRQLISIGILPGYRPRAARPGGPGEVSPHAPYGHGVG